MSMLKTDLLLQRSERFKLHIKADIPLRGITGIYGPSGSGKTSLLACIAGLLRAEGESSVSTGDRIWQDNTTWLPTHQRSVGYVFQDARLFPHLDVAGNLDFAWRRRKSNTGPSRESLCEWLQLEDLLRQRPDQLSRGQQQRVAIARALLSAPQVLLLDEPLANLDHRSRREIVRQLRKLHEELGIAMVYVSHDMAELAELADWLLVLEAGNLVAEGPLIELSSRLELALAHEEQAAAIVTASIVAQDDDFGLTELTLEQQPLYVNQRTLPQGSRLRLRIPARDVSLCLLRPQQTSILNILAARVDSIESGSASRALVRVRIGEQFLLARLTRKSIAALELAPGSPVFAQVKSAALIRDEQVDD